MHLRELGTFESSWEHLVICWKHLEAFGNIAGIWIRLGAFAYGTKAVCHWETFLCILENLDEFARIWKHLLAFCCLWEHLHMNIPHI